MEHTIYFNETRLILSDRETESIKHLIEKPDTLFEDQANDTSIERIIKEMQTEKVTAGVLINSDIEELLKGVKSHMKVIKAGGGLVHFDSETVLLIFRRGKWDLPKGKLEEGESVESAALREVTEETGLKELQLEEQLITTYHTYPEKEKLILKESHWFLMKSTREQQLIPQTEEDIEQCVWVKLNDMETYLKNTHPSIIDVLKKGMEKLHYKERI